MSNKVKIKSTEILSNERFPLKKIQYEIEKSDGTSEELTREVYFPSNAVTALLFNREKNTVILTQQFRLPSFLNNNPTGMLLETCAGLVEENEDPTAAIMREIEEETGYRLAGVKKAFELYMTPGSVTEMVHFYVAEYLPEQKVSEGGGLAEESENIEIFELPFEEAFIKVQTGEIKDAKTVLLLQYAKLYLFKGEKAFDIL